jgi:hypothetical protein
MEKRSNAAKRLKTALNRRKIVVRKMKAKAAKA